MKLKIKNAEILTLLSGKQSEYPKYVTQLLNLANSNAQGTRPKVVGQMSDLIQSFDGKTIDEWRTWYIEKMPNAIEDAVDRIFPMIKRLEAAIELIDEKMVRKWVEELVIEKTFAGLKFQAVILHKVAEAKSSTYRIATKSDEAKGVDGWIGKMPVSIKPVTYKTKALLSEKIDVPIIFYDKKKDGISVEYNF